MPVAQDHLATIRKAVAVVLRRHGLRAESKRSWCRGDDAEGWVVISWDGGKWNTKAEAEASLTAAVWPPGTREHRSELCGRDVVPFVGGDVPLLGNGEKVAGDPFACTYDVVAVMSADEVAVQVRRAEAFGEAMVAWADAVLDARVSAPLMSDGDAVAALLAQHPDWPGIDPFLDRLTAGFQRDPRPIGLGRVIDRWRRERGLPQVPLPAWSRYASGPCGSGVLGSPRAELLAGLGTAVEFQFADGTARLPTADDLPDADQIRRWRKESRRAPLPDGVLRELPEWLPYAGWLEVPEPPATGARRRLWPWRTSR